MSRFNLTTPLVRIFAAALALTVVFAAGLTTGLYLLAPLQASDDSAPGDAAHAHDADLHHTDGQDHADDHHSEHADEDHHEHLALTEQAFHNLGLNMGQVSRGDYWKSILVPARVVEIPGRSDLSVSAPVGGVITRVHILPGQSLLGQQPLFEIRLTDEALTDAQSKLLALLARTDVAQQEIDRLAPLVSSGAVAASKIRELRYDLERLRAERTTLTQELRGRGMPDAAIESIVKLRQLATTLEIYPPEFVAEGDPRDGSSGYSVENVHVHPGKTVGRGADLCSIAYHRKLYIEGTAFEDDLVTLDRIMENGWPIVAELHQTLDDHADVVARDSLQLLRVDNHVDEETQTVRFYVELDNQISRLRKEDGRVFELWQFRPGQRLHLRLPVAHWQNQWTLPAEAVVVEGPDAIVFAEHDDHEESTEFPANHDHDHDHDHDDHADERAFIELEAVPVRLLHRDDRTVVIADDGQLHADDRIALDQAYKLHLAMKMQAAAGGGHHHDHEH